MENVSYDWKPSIFKLPIFLQHKICGCAKKLLGSLRKPGGDIKNKINELKVATSIQMLIIIPGFEIPIISSFLSD